VDRAPGKPLPRIVLEFLRFALSQEGQKILADQGFIPLDGTKAEAELAKIQ
jgi:phosphate transport system substrate-binding protein